MKQYYFVGILLPALSFDSPPEISFDQLQTILKDNLSQRDFEKTRVIRRLYDLLNIRALLQERELDPRGEMSPLELEEALVSKIGLPEYVYAFMDTYNTKEEKIRHFPLLLAKFYQAASVDKDPFLRRYLSFERELRLVFTAFRAKRLHRDLKIELQYEDPEEELIAQLLAEQDAKVFEPPEPFLSLKPLFQRDQSDPLALQRDLDRYRTETIESFVGFADTFSIERILAYYAQFLIVDQWSKLNKKQGLEKVAAMFAEGK